MVWKSCHSSWRFWIEARDLVPFLGEELCISISTGYIVPDECSASHNLDGKMDRWISLSSWFWWFHNVYFDLTSPKLHQLKCCCSRGHFLSYPMLNESAITIPEELSKYLDCAWIWGLHSFVVNLVVSLSVLMRRHTLKSLKSSMAMDTVISSNTLMWRFFSDWLQDPQLFSDRLLLHHNQLIAHPSTSLNWEILCGKNELCSKWLEIDMASENGVNVEEAE